MVVAVVVVVTVAVAVAVAIAVAVVVLGYPALFLGTNVFSYMKRGKTN